MATTPNRELLAVSPRAIQDLRKKYNLDTPKRLEDAIDILDLWIKKQGHFLKKDFNRAYLDVAMVNNKGSIENTKSKMDKMCTLRTLLPEFFVVSNVKLELGHSLDYMWMVPLPKATDDHYRIIIMKFFNKFNAENVFGFFQYVIAISEYLEAHEYSNGFIIVIDMQGVNLLEAFAKVNVVEFQQLLTIIFKGFGARVKGINILTQSKSADMFLKIVKSFFSQKIASRIQIQQTLEELYEIVPRSRLPVEYGGPEKSLSELNNMWLDEITTPEYVAYLQHMTKARTDETLRQSDKFNEEIMGMPGSFRHLSVD